MRRLAIIAAAALLSTASVQAQFPTEVVGEVKFANSGAANAQAAFQRGVAQLHNFQYSDAAKAFQEAQAADPAFVMAVWGEAMTHNHPVWMEQDLEKGRAALAKLGPTPAARLAKARTERERAFLQAVETLYGEGTKEQRDFAYSSAMERLYRAYPTDVDAASFYALSLLGLAHKGRDVPLYMRAAGILEEFFPANQRHPGVVHYLIHSYDDPTHAPLGVRTARLYSAIAPGSDHAHHMTSHIFIALADWQGTIDANRRAMDVVNRKRAGEGKSAAFCGHYNEWLHYAYLQTGENDKAQAVQAGCHGFAVRELAEAASKAAPSERPGQAASYGAMRSRYIVETGHAAADAPLRATLDSSPRTALELAYGDLLLARGKKADVAGARARLVAAAGRAPRDKMHPLEIKRLSIITLQGDGLNDIASGNRDAGIAALQKAAEIERLMEVPFGPPLVEKPSFELLAEELLAAGRREEAAEAFRQALKLAPGRRISSVQLAKLEAERPNGTKTAAAAPHKH